MAQIDSGLGWSCEEEFYTDTAGTVLSTRYAKEYDGGAMCAVLENRHGYYTAYIISTVEENAKVMFNDSLEEQIYSVTVNDKLWYISQGSGSGLPDRPGTFPIVVSLTDFGTGTPEEREVIVRAITGAADYEEKSSEKIPTTNYVHEYVEGVLKLLPTISDAQIDALFN